MLGLIVRSGSNSIHVRHAKPSRRVVAVGMTEIVFTCFFGLSREKRQVSVAVDEILNQVPGSQNDIFFVFFPAGI